MELMAAMRSRARVSAATLVGTPSRLEMAMMLFTESVDAHDALGGPLLVVAFELVGDVY